jgi:hypothetical protein
MICGDLKVLSMLLEQQSGYNKYPCFLCEWDSRAKSQHWTQKQWPNRVALKPGDENVVLDSLIDPKKVLLPHLHIKLGLMRQFVKALLKEGECFKYLCRKFPDQSDAKLKEGIFVGPYIRKLFSDDLFETTMKTVEREAWNAFKEVISKFLGNYKDPNYKQIMEKCYKIL